jgi:hypothetical protein
LQEENFDEETDSGAEQEHEMYVKKVAEEGGGGDQERLEAQEQELTVQ